jgi:hypothetical protein
MSKLPLIALCALLAFPLTSITASASTKSDPRPVTKEFQVTGLSWSKKGDLAVLWAPFNTDGMLEICGLYSSTGNTVSARFSDEAMRQARIRLGKKSKLANLKFFKFALSKGRANRHVGEMANCKITKYPFPADPTQLELFFRKGSYRISK